MRASGILLWVGIALFATDAGHHAQGEPPEGAAGKQAAADGEAADAEATDATTEDGAKVTGDSTSSAASSPAAAPAERMPTRGVSIGAASPAAPVPVAAPVPDSASDPAVAPVANPAVPALPSATPSPDPNDPEALLQDSLSCGSANRGSLRKASRMPRNGRGFDTPEPWWSRDRRYGTDELVALIQRVARRVDEEHSGAMLGVADLSSARGGAIRGHRSHQSGRDADLIFYSLDADGKPFHPDQHMGYYTYSGRAHYAKAPKYQRNIKERYFDLPRNWALVKALMSDRVAHVEHMFVSRRIRRWLLRYAEKSGEPPEVVKQASKILKRPKSTGGHNDHMHIRVSCDAGDIRLGRCKNHIARGRRKFYSRIRCPARQAKDAASQQSSRKRPAGESRKRSGRR